MQRQLEPNRTSVTGIWGFVTNGTCDGCTSMTSCVNGSNAGGWERPWGCLWYVWLKNNNYNDAVAGVWESEVCYFTCCFPQPTACAPAGAPLKQACPALVAPGRPQAQPPNTQVPRSWAGLLIGHSALCVPRSSHFATVRGGEVSGLAGGRCLFKQLRGHVQLSPHGA